jgi:DNA-3-methyladenine glycosylase I
MPRPRFGKAGCTVSEQGDLVTGADDRPRCRWGAEPEIYRRYHDEEWGRPELDDQRLFEKLCLEGFQAGLSWLTILRKRPRFREVFAGFDLEAVAAFGDDDIARLMADEGIVRNRAKIEATISNARAARELQHAEGSILEFVSRYRPEAHPPLRRFADAVASTPESTALSKELKRRGFRFVGPTTVYAFMQAMGLVNDHLLGCWVHDEVGGPPEAGGGGRASPHPDELRCRRLAGEDIAVVEQRQGFAEDVEGCWGDTGGLLEEGLRWGAARFVGPQQHSVGVRRPSLVPSGEMSPASTAWPGPSRSVPADRSSRWVPGGAHAAAGATSTSAAPEIDLVRMTMSAVAGSTSSASASAGPPGSSRVSTSGGTVVP